MNLADNIGIVNLIRNYGADFVNISVAWLISTSLFAALIVYVAKHPQKRTKPLKIAFTIMFLGGMTIYCVCHYYVLTQVRNGIISDTGTADMLKWVKDPDSVWLYIPYVIMRSVIDVGFMFYGRGNTEVFYALPISQYPIAVAIFWLMQMLAFFTTATALLIRFGNDLLRWIRLKTSRVSNVNVIFGVSSDTLAFGRNFADKDDTMLVFVDSVVSEDFENTIRELGGFAYAEKSAVKGDIAFLKKLHLTEPGVKFRLFTLSSDYDRNFQYARAICESLENLQISPDQTELFLLGIDEWKGMNFQSSESKYGYGDVVSFDEREISAHLLISKYPLCNAIHFDENGLATEDMSVLIVGFGRTGHEVLRKVIANGQFEGSNFRATIYDPNFKNREGFFKSQYPNMFANYEIDFEPHNARGSEIFSYIRENASKLRYIVICLEDRDTARDIAIHMVDRLQNLGYPLNVYTCDSKSVRCYSLNVKECETHWIYDSEIIYSGELDKFAKELNHRYSGGKDVNSDWKNCGYLDRMSSRASVDYLMPLIRKIKSASETLTAEQRENLAKSEHLRWCAFHYTFGFDTMTHEEFATRIKNRQQEIQETGKSKIKPTKDIANLKHACLVDWDELDEISSIENSLTNANKNYKDSDRTNVDMIAELG